jgi:hypothetical protein
MEINGPWKILSQFKISMNCIIVDIFQSMLLRRSIRGSLKSHRARSCRKKENANTITHQQDKEAEVQLMMAYRHDIFWLLYQW